MTYVLMYLLGGFSAWVGKKQIYKMYDALKAKYVEWRQ